MPWPCTTWSFAVMSTSRARRAPIRVTSPANGKSFHGCFVATWQSASASYASGRTWTRDVERMTPAAKHLITRIALSYTGLPWKYRARRTGEEMPKTLAMKITKTDISFRCAAAWLSRQLAPRSSSITQAAAMVNKTRQQIRL
uniref:Uncharacterized protein MANES_18G141500 n=1 Tax=Rhizophora mucronata TaxID=61149 RepID=A0A2P2IYQ0_RHIMU